MPNQNINIKELNSNINIQILNYLYRNCNIVGTKIIFRQYQVPIIQLDDYTRIWMLPEELGIIQVNRRKKSE